MTDELSEIHRTLAAPSPEFEAWVASMDKKLWARFDLSAARLGWEAAKAQASPPMTAPADSRISNERLTEFLARAEEDHWAAYYGDDLISALTELRERRGQDAGMVYAPHVVTALQTAYEAVQNSMPTQAHYPEPRERHDRALRLLEAALAAPPPAQAAGVTEAARDMLAALKIVAKWFENTGSSINARWERIPAQERLAFVEAMRASVAKAEAALSAQDREEGR